MPALFLCYLVRMIIAPVTGLILILISFITAFMSGLFGMAGGMILMGVIAWVLPVSLAMVLHGITQFTSNGFRAFIHRENIMWNTIGYYLIGLFITVGIFQVLQLVLSKPILMIFLGASAFIAYVPKKIFHLDILKPKHAIFAGVLNTGLQLTVGVSGATLDIFFLNRKLGRHKVVATKAFTQAIGHMAKLYYFGIALNTEATAQFNQLPIWLILGILAMTFLGTGISERFLNKMNDHQFHTWTRHIVTAIGIVYILRGINLL